jgi:hypothetical protein
MEQGTRPFEHLAEYRSFSGVRYVKELFTLGSTVANDFERNFDIMCSPSLSSFMEEYLGLD